MIYTVNSDLNLTMIEESVIDATFAHLTEPESRELDFLLALNAKAQSEVL